MTCRNTYTTPCLVSLAGVQEKVKPMLDIYKFLTLTERSVEVREWRADLRFLQQRKVNVCGWWVESHPLEFDLVRKKVFCEMICCLHEFMSNGIVVHRVPTLNWNAEFHRGPSFG